MIQTAVREAVESRTGAFRVDRAQARPRGTNFYYALLFLPAVKRQAVADIYAFSRLTDDLVDEAPDCSTAHAQLDAWQDEITSALAGAAHAHPLATRMAHACRRFGIDAGLPLKLIDGCRMDISPPNYQTADDLDNYCYHVASVVGLMCLEVFGYRNPSARAYAINLGRALQRTNILRDLASDAAAGRLYLPAEDLARFGFDPEPLLRLLRCPAADPEKVLRSEAFAGLMRLECGRARSYYRAAADALAPEDRRCLLAARIMGKLYERLLSKIERAGTRVVLRRAALSTGTKLAVAFRTFGLAIVGR